MSRYQARGEAPSRTFVSVRVTAAERAAIEAAAAVRGVSVSELVRAALAAVLSPAPPLVASPRPAAPAPAPAPAAAPTAEQPAAAPSPPRRATLPEDAPPRVKAPVAPPPSPTPAKAAPRSLSDELAALELELGAAKGRRR